MELQDHFVQVGKFMTYLREGLGMSIEHVAREMHVSEEELQRLEAGIGRVSLLHMMLFLFVVSSHEDADKLCKVWTDMFEQEKREIEFESKLIGIWHELHNN